MVHVWDVKTEECLFQGKSLDDYEDVEVKEEFNKSGFGMKLADFHVKAGQDVWWKSADGSCMVGKDGNVVIIVAMQEEETKVRRNEA